MHYDLESVQINEYNIGIKLFFAEEVNMDIMTTKEIAEIWNISARRVALLCSQGIVRGVMKKGKT